MRLIFDDDRDAATLRLPRRRKTLSNRDVTRRIHGTIDTATVVATVAATVVATVAATVVATVAATIAASVVEIDLCDDRRNHCNSEPVSDSK